MDNTFLEGGIENLEKVKEKLQEESGKQEAFNEAEAALKTKQKDLENQRKYMTDKIAAATKDRRAELKKQQDELVDAAAKDLKEAEKRRATSVYQNKHDKAEEYKSSAGALMIVGVLGLALIIVNELVLIPITLNFNKPMVYGVMGTVFVFFIIRIISISKLINFF